ncbi:MAG: hypothetical protein ACPGVO_20260 [Spirulinaceae cyanobacterium]
MTSILHPPQVQTVQTLRPNPAVRYQVTPEVGGTWLNPRDPLTLLMVVGVFGLTVAIAAVKAH